MIQGLVRRALIRGYASCFEDKNIIYKPALNNIPGYMKLSSRIIS
jgi:hypothetical protein